MTLYLTSRGFGSPVVGEKIFSHLKKEAKELRLFYIPTARYGYSRKNKLIEGLEAAGFQKEQIIWFDHRYPERYGDEIPDLIYVCGGNTFLLQHYMKESGFLPKLKGWIEAGVPYVGASAGTHLIEQSIEHLKYFDENKIGETDFAGLGLFFGITVCHYTKEREEIARLLQEEGKYPVSLIGNEEVLLAEGEKSDRLQLRYL